MSGPLIRAAVSAHRVRQRYLRVAPLSLVLGDTGAVEPRQFPGPLTLFEKNWPKNQRPKSAIIPLGLDCRFLPIQSVLGFGKSSKVII
ncbi:hypothetical protein COW36_11595 [bacterium (Candidatus Blackallbacteria) CG17_big_fil_post_rev_8_21_14_2_50_48_46]|uniref:Uncharacterized protein n=1 Tax=bacterium (Candidatus Blackallbacteria) CG17_big_fil_post_rev_8_21_14_2_50_48_46 TaxID=2014261 RepID=A0A2M7G4E5_9BACT|nr:MAG: hypothetical protein COW64_21815 [bacterium (Candidatus Blackallbacteria) CG18_big_fil_WC_8_21_14_2_50_49_26]PIW16781.1 MAG: hypothetical protein COW36_11595 [bacterium (Candidatus Blackallbacteria) CG17_big_fil_post_rev_8_21_14_2_50_48_46]PIW47075.1 MAG: hypothetical protein COW20_13825 [bacterium (Candidatus Blackallbacteria) CG13_big_fil_rev_8_21_14_2_50_49_14]